MLSVVALLVLLGLLVFGVPIFVALGVVSIGMLALEGRPLFDAALTAISGLNSSAFVAVLFFVIAAKFMQSGGIARVLIEAAEAWVGWMRGGLGLVAVLGTTFFAAVSGSSVVTAMTMGTLLIPIMVAKHYDRHFALGTLGAAGTLGILIPPSLSMILYGLVANESVARLFLAGVVPGLLQALILGVFVVLYSRKKNYVSGERLSRGEFIARNVRALPSLLIPIVVFVGIYGGYASVAESAALAAVVALAVAMLVYREIHGRDIFGLLTDAVKSAGAITFIVMFAMLFAHWLTGSGVPTAIVEFAVGNDFEPWQFLLLLSVIMITLGTVLDAIAVLLIVTPIVLPTLAGLGIDRIHFGIVLIVNMEIAFLTPPIGLNLFVLSNIAKAPMAETIRGVAPFVALLFGFLLIVILFPELSLWLPNAVYD
jgi:C4-dicarboxylate transporter, DctM subunit